MTYEEFKKELYRNLLQQEKEEKLIRLFERRTICADKQDLRILRALNLSCYGVADVMVHEDILCVICGAIEQNRILHWKVRPLYERFKKEGWQGVLPELIMKMEHMGSEGEVLHWENRTYEECRDRLILRPINYHRCAEQLNNCIYWRQGDIALVLYGVIHDGEKNYITMKMQREITKNWNLPDSSLIMNALINSYVRMPPRLFPAAEAMMSGTVDKGVFMPGEKGEVVRINRKNKQEGMRGYRLTTTRQLNGAVAIYYPGVKERLGELLGEDYYIGFPGIHEAVIHPVSRKEPEDMRAAIRHVNAVFDEKDMLTNRIFRYSVKRREMEEI